MDLFQFSVAVVALLILPGTTNAVLALSARDLMPVRFVLLLATVATGYLVILLAVSTFAAPFLHAHPEAAREVKLLAAIWVLALAVRLWATGTAETIVPVGPKQLFVTTVLNPKAIIVGLTLMPAVKGAASLSTFGVFTLAVVATSSAWLLLGRIVIGRSEAMHQLARRIGATVLVAFSFTLAVSAVADAMSV